MNLTARSRDSLEWWNQIALTEKPNGKLLGEIRAVHVLVGAIEMAWVDFPTADFLFFVLEEVVKLDVGKGTDVNEWLGH